MGPLPASSSDNNLHILDTTTLTLWLGDLQPENIHVYSEVPVIRCHWVMPCACSIAVLGIFFQGANLTECVCVILLCSFENSRHLWQEKKKFKSKCPFKRGKASWRGGRLAQERHIHTRGGRRMYIVNTIVHVRCVQVSRASMSVVGNESDWNPIQKDRC